MTKIEWAHRTWNPVRARLLSTGAYGYHCEKVSAGCAGCYAETWNLRGLENQGTRLPYKTGHRDQLQHVIDAKALMAPFAWRKPQRIFVGSMTDIFGDWVTDAMLDQILAVIALNPQHIFMLLTKRPGRAKAYLSHFGEGGTPHRLGSAINAAALRTDDEATFRRAVEFKPVWPLPNLALGTSVEDQPSADERIPLLLDTPARWRFLSAEPLLGAVDLAHRPIGDSHYEDWLQGWAWDDVNGDLTRDIYCADRGPHIDLVIAGGMSGRRAAPLHPDIVRSLRDQCAAAGTPFFFKQWGEWAPAWGSEREQDEVLGDMRHVHRFEDGQRVGRFGKKDAGRTLDGAIHSALPAGWPA